MKRTALLLGSLLAPAIAFAQMPQQFEWQEFSKRIKQSETIASHGSDVVGDAVSLSNGALSFRATDISLPGNDGLSVEFTRTYAAVDRPEFSVMDGMLGDWQVEAPHISGVFGPDWVVGSPAIGSRCSSAAEPATPGIPYFTAKTYWQGASINVPGSSGELLRTASGIQKPTTSAATDWLWVTNDHTHLKCLTSILNGTGEGFYAETAAGTKYWFNYMAQTRESSLKSAPIIGGGTPSTYVLPRKKNWLYATRVEDRFGNYVNYTYTNAWNQPGKLTKIEASDGRTISIAYNASNRVTSVSNGVNSWTYSYGTTSKSRPTLTGVSLPDTSSWTIAFSQLTDAEMVSGSRDTCTVTPSVASTVPTPVGSITHPSGAKGEFTLYLQEHGRSSVPVSCSNVLIGGAHPINDGSDDVNRWATSAYSWTLLQKKLSGPGLTTAVWDYDYEPRVSVIMYPGTTAANPVCPVGVDCSLPLCTNAGCARASETDVYGPNGEWTRYRHGNTYRYDEGLLVKVEHGRWEDDGVAGMPHLRYPLRTTTYSHDLSMSGSTTYPKFYGATQRDIGDAHPSQYHRPQLSTVTNQDGVTFTRTHQTFEYFAKPAQILRQSSLGFHKTETYTYKNFYSPWVIGQVETVTCNSSSQTGCSGAPVVASVGYHPVTAKPTDYSKFGQVQQTLTYDTTSAVSTGQRGTVKTVADGNSRITTLSSWRRGIPRSVSYHDGSAQSALVSDQGWITQTTDELLNVTGYGYDAMGRVTSVTWPTGHVPAWTSTTRVFEKVNAVEHGIAANHWRLTETTGSALKRTYYDALWRPLVTHDTTSDASAVSRYTRRNFDIHGRETYVSYPSATSTASTGVTTDYDVLGRKVFTSQSSELGDLDTSTEYLTGFTTRVTNPRLKQTTTNYTLFDEPSYDLPRVLTEPAGVTTTIARDAFGEPTTITRTGTYEGLPISTMRRFVYDSQRRLCKRIDPESGVTLMDYDPGGNLAWTARSTTLTNTVDCERVSVSVGLRSVRSYDARNRVLGVDHSAGTADETYTYYADGALKTAATTDGGTWTYTYNNRRLPTGESLALDSRTFGIGYTYSANGHVETLTYPSGLSVAFNPNAIGEAQQAGTYATGVGYHPDGTLSGFTYGNGVIHSRTRNTRALPARIRDTFSGLARFDHTFTYDKNGNITQIADGVAGNLENRFLVYDDRDRMTNADAPNQFGAELIAYDPLDNVRRSAVANTGGDTYAIDFRFVYDTNWRLDRINNPASLLQWDFTHNGFGETTFRSGGGSSWNYTWNAAGRLTQAGNDAYVYDAHGHRTRATRTGPASTRYQVYTRSGELLYIEDTRDNERTDYINLAGRLVAQRSRPTASTTATPSYHHVDIIGSAVARTNAAGVQTERTIRTPYGQPYDGVYREGPGFAGHVTDKNTGLTYMQQRYYDPIALRFISADPVDVSAANGSNFNRYSYANGNPLRFVDPDGRYFESAWDAFSLSVGVVNLAGNVSGGNWSAAAADFGGVVVDTVAIAVPVVPGGASVAIRAAREASEATQVAKEITLTASQHGEAAQHAADAIRAGHPDVLTIDRAGAASNRRESIGGLDKVPGQQLDEYPPAMFSEGGAGASVRPIDPANNMSAGACIGNSCRGLADGEKIRIKVEENQ